MAVASRVGQLLEQQLVEQASIWQAGQRIVRREPQDLLLVVLEIYDDRLGTSGHSINRSAQMRDRVSALDFCSGSVVSLPDCVGHETQSSQATIGLANRPRPQDEDPTRKPDSRKTQLDDGEIGELWQQRQDRDHQKGQQQNQSQRS